jgi:hypothetical protein
VAIFVEKYFRDCFVTSFLAMTRIGQTRKIPLDPPL